MIPIGTVLTLELESAERSEKFKCRLVDKKGGDFYIDYPISLQTNKVAFLFNGTQIKATFVGPDGASVFLFESEIKGRIKSNIPMLIVSYPGDEHLIKIQRRQYVRIETAIDIALHPLQYEFDPITTMTDDISAGGTGVFVPADTNLQVGMSIQAWLVLLMHNGEYHYMKLLCRVVRIVPNTESKHRVSLQFIDVSSHVRQLLLRFCFERQLELKKKGLFS
jgi:c-di-GMP-binding flagellar brake protein YcgR